MFNKIDDFLKNKSISDNILLLNKKDSLNFIELLNNKKMKIFWFDWFTLENWKYQIQQDYSRDYSRFSLEDSYLLSKEYFLKDNTDSIFYYFSYGKDISYRDNL